MLKWLNIKAKLIVVLLAVSLIPLGVVSWFSLKASEESISREVFNHLINMRDAKAAQIERLFAQTRADIRVLAGSSHITTALDAFRWVVQDGEIDPTQYGYFESLEYGPAFQQFLNEYGYHDLLLVTDEGDVVYSARRETDLAQNLFNGPLRDSLLGKALEQGLENVVSTDFTVYPPSDHRIISFLISPIRDGNETLGAVVLKMTDHALNEIMLDHAGMGRTGEAYLVGMDNLMRSDSHLDPTNRSVDASFANPDKGSVDTEATRAALAGETGNAIILDYRDVPVLSAFKPLPFGQTTFALMAEIDRSEAFAPIEDLKQLVAILAASAVVVILVVAYLLANVITRPILSLTRSSIDIAEGNLSQEVPVTRDDELGVLSENFNKMRLSIQGKIEEIEQNREALRIANETLEDRVAARTRELEQKSQLISTIFESMSQGVVAFDRDLKLISANDRYSEIRGYPKEMIEEGRPFEDFMRYDVERNEFGDGDPKEIFAERIARAQRFESHEYERKRPDGRFIEVRGGPIPGGGFVSTYSDISERTRLQETLLKSEEQFRKTFEQAAVGVAQVDVNGPWLQVNPALCKMLGYPADELKKETFQSLTYPEDLEPGMNQVAQLIAGEMTTYSMEKRYVRKDGSLVWVHLTVSLVRDAEGEPDFFISIIQDISERKEMELALARSMEEAKAATQAKSEFLATMSHEIRTPMNGVIGMIDLLQQTALTEDQGEMVDTVRSSAYALLTIINDILDFSKIEAGKLDLENIPISICDVVEGVAETLSSTARGKKVWLRAFVDPKIPDAVMGDPVRIRQVLFNLGGNAVKFTEVGSVTIRADLIGETTEPTAKIRISIIDTGIGLTDEGKANLFKAFTQAESSTTRRFGGTGLGLTICQRLIELMGGTIDVESTYGEGSTFSVTVDLPVASEHSFTSDAHDLSGLRILYVANNTLTAAYLESSGADVTVHGTLDDVPERLQEAMESGTPFDVVFLVVASEREDRYNAIREAQARPGLEGTRFVLGVSNRVRADREDLDNTIYIETAPLKRAMVIKSTAVAAGRASPDVNDDDAAIATTTVEPMTIDEAEAADQLILLAEDNLTNQKVILRQLNNLGYTAEVANDGKEALARLGERSFAILLTDCHMPNLDGFGLTEAIRAGKVDLGKRLPIVAITASALKAEVDHCYEVGMDDFLSKPVEMPKLKAALKKWMPKADSRPSPSATEDEPQASVNQEGSSDEPASDSALDLNVLTEIFGDDLSTIKEVLNDYVGPSQECCAEIEEAFSSQSAAGVGAGAHKLKSSSRSIGAGSLGELCADLEIAGKTEDWDKINQLVPQLPGMLRTVIENIENL